MAGCTDNHIWLSEQRCGRLWVYDSVHIPDLVFYYRYFKCLKSLFDRFPSGMIAWIRMYRTFYLPDSVIVPAIRFSLWLSLFPCGIMVCYRMGRAISITTMNYSVAIFVYSRMIRYPDNAITELRYSRISNKDSREWREHAPFWIQISQNLHLQKCININPLMEIIKKNISHTRLPVILHL